MKDNLYYPFVPTPGLVNRERWLVRLYERKYVIAQWDSYKIKFIVLLDAG